jgi:hypothetical protein
VTKTNVLVPGQASKTSLLLVNAALATASLVIAGLFAELTVRAIGEEDENGQFRFRGRLLRPYHVPFEPLRPELEKLAAMGGTSDLGWETFPGERLWYGKYRARYNELGARVEERSGMEHESPELIVHLYGNSFAHGDEVPYRDTYGAMLEERLRDSGFDVVVLNFGVAGYGMDQAYLRYLKKRKLSKPDLVLFGYQHENTLRNVNLLPLYRMRTRGIPISKPRFVLDGDDVRLINYPALTDADRLMSVFSRPEEWELIRYEPYYRADDFAVHPWRRSKLISLIEELVSPRRIDENANELARRILRKFRDKVVAQDSDFLMVTTPQKADVRALEHGDEPPYIGFIQELSEEFEIVNSHHQFRASAATAGTDALFADIHYSRLGNEQMALSLFGPVVNRLEKLSGSLASD